MEITHYKGRWWIAGFLAIAFMLIFLMSLVVHPVQAGVLYYGSEYNFSAVVLPNNSYVMQGQNITQGNCYDLSGVYGFSGKLAHWTNDNGIGEDDPDLIIELEHPRKVCIEPSKFPVGRYFQWDGMACDGSGNCAKGFGHGNAYVFFVAPPLVDIYERIVVKSANITIMQNGEEVQIPVTLTQRETYVGTPEPTQLPGLSGTIELPVVTATPTPAPRNLDVQDRNGNPVVGGVGALPVVTQKSPVWMWLPVVAIIAGLLWRKK